MVLRKVTFRLYPNVTQSERRVDLLGLHQRLYNTALEERIAAYQKNGKSPNYNNQAKSLTEWRLYCPALAGVNAQSQQNTLKRLDLAYQAFFRRVEAGETPGFPRFKSIRRYPGWGYNTHGDGWRLFAGEGMRHGQVRLSAVGMIKMRGKARTSGIIKTAEVQHKDGCWYLSVTVECEPQRAAGTAAKGMDWGLETFATVCSEDDKTLSVPNLRFLDKPQRQKLKILQQAVSRKPNKRSNNRRKAVARLSAESRLIANRRKDFLHKTSAKLVEQYGLIATEELNVKNMTASGGACKKGLNRRILDTSPSTFINLLKTKAEEAGSMWVDVPTRLVKPIQTCHRCGIRRKKTLAERDHRCDCGASCSRDENAARVMLNWALHGNVTGRESVRGGESLTFSDVEPRNSTYTALAV